MNSNGKTFVPGPGGIMVPRKIVGLITVEVYNDGTSQIKPQAFDELKRPVMMPMVSVADVLLQCAVQTFQQFKMELVKAAQQQKGFNGTENSKEIKPA